MASTLKDKISNAFSRDQDQQQPRYMLSVTAGPARDAATHHAVVVNGPDALAFENDHVRVKLRVSIRDYTGLPRDAPRRSAYFDHPSRRSDLYSIAFSFVPKHRLSAVDARWGNDFDHPIRHRLPPGFNTAFRIVKDFIDPGLECDAYADRPWLLGPALSCWFAFRVGDKVEPGADFAAPGDDPPLSEGGDGSGAALRQQLGLPEDATARRKYFLNQQNRESLVFEQDRLYQADFFNPYLDFNKFAVCLPGFSLGVTRFIDDKTHQLTYVFKDAQSGDVFFVVVLTLLFGQQLEDHLQSATA